MKMKLLLMGCVLGLVAGCKIAIIVPSGGDVVSSNAAHDCAEGNVCEFEINTGQLPFSETFAAIASPGYEFEKWSDGGDFKCAKSTNPTCTINIADDSLSSLVVSLFDSGYAMPVFKDVGIDTDGDGIRNALDDDDDNDGIFDIDDTCPLDPSPSCSEGVLLTDTVTINGTEWAQVDLFANLSWSAVNAICPEGPCSGVLNGYNMAGWTWASFADVTALFDFYICGPSAGGCFDGYEVEVESSWAPMMFVDGMRRIVGYEDENVRSLDGHVSDAIATPPQAPQQVEGAYWVDRPIDGIPNYDNAKSLARGSLYGVAFRAVYRGAWLYRTP